MRTLPLLATALALSGCGAASRLSAVGKAPAVSATEPVPAPAFEPSIAHPAPAPTAAPSASLFRPGAADLFRDARAHRKGDLLLVRVAIQDRASFSNQTSRSRAGDESGGIAGLLGLQGPLSRLLPGNPDTGSLVGTNSKSTSAGSGDTTRNETLRTTLSAIVTDVLPNGNMLIRARQEVRVNFELRELVVTGVIRPQDIGRDNAIEHSRIAEARVIYGGRGQLTDAQQARWGQQILDALFPF